MEAPGGVARPVEVAPGVLVFTSRTMNTTSTVVSGAGQALLVDPAWHAEELEAIADALAARGLRVACGWATHAHHDHLLWHPRFGPAPRLATSSAADVAAEHLNQLRAALEPTLPAGLRSLAGAVQAYDGARLPWRGPVAQVVAHQAHAPGHGALWLPGPGVLLAGDMLSEQEIPLCAETGIEVYRDGLDQLAPYVARARVLIPGHGTPALAGTPDGPIARLAADRAYLDALAASATVSDPRLRDAPDWLLAEHEANVAAAGDAQA